MIAATITILDAGSFKTFLKDLENFHYLANWKHAVGYEKEPNLGIWTNEICYEKGINRFFIKFLMHIPELRKPRKIFKFVRVWKKQMMFCGINIIFAVYQIFKFCFERNVQLWQEIIRWWKMKTTDSVSIFLISVHVLKVWTKFFWRKLKDWKHIDLISSQLFSIRSDFYEWKLQIRFFSNKMKKLMKWLW